MQSVWHTNSADPVRVAALAESLGCPVPIAEILVSRNICTVDEANAFLHPSLETFLAAEANHPQKLLGMDGAVERILDAIRAAEPILIYGDYDVDGTTAIVLLKTTLERVALALNPSRPTEVRYHVPHRIREGYGMQKSVLATAAASGIRLVISVDTGIRAFAEAIEARSLGLDLIVTDHHLPEDGSIPDCLAVINPAQPGCTYQNKHLCGAAVAFKLAHALLLAAAPFTPDPAAFSDRTNRLLIPSFLKLVAIATVADAVPLTGENRTIAALGLSALANPVQPGLRALMEVAKLPLNLPPSATEVAFRLAPRINAAGRMDVASDVVELFLTRDPKRAWELASKLDALNTDRRDSEARALAAIDQHLLTLLTPEGEFPPECLILDHPDWHRGVLGILASRVVERTHRPALVLTHAEGDAHGSGRSIPGFHLLNAITAAGGADGAEPIFHRFGGHAHAVGFSLPSSLVSELRTRISAHSALHLGPSVLAPSISYDSELDLRAITSEFFASVQRLAPFGHGNPEPVFLIRQASLARPPRVIKERHVCLELIIDGADGGVTLSAMGWSRGASAAALNRNSWTLRCAELGLTAGSTINLLARLRRKTGTYANQHLDGLELEMCDLQLAREQPPATQAAGG